MVYFSLQDTGRKRFQCETTKLKSEQQNRRISNIECRRMGSLRSVIFL